MDSVPRPFYGRFAWAYDLLSHRPVAAECAIIAALFTDRGCPPGARVLDAGCGTGRYTVELGRLGYWVTGIDASPDLLAVAHRQPGARAVTFLTADLTQLPSTPQYDAVLCRGVLNDVLDDRDRRGAFLAFARVLIAGGVLVLDVRDWEATLRRKTQDPVHERRVETGQGTLTFRSETRLDHPTRQMRITERHTLTVAGVTTVADHAFVMRCWTRDELDARLASAGFAAVAYRGAYDGATPVGSTDRLVVAATRA
jgi:SAM-dependent methyltransferase